MSNILGAYHIRGGFFCWPGLIQLLDGEFLGCGAAVRQDDVQQVEAFCPAAGGEVFGVVGEGALPDQQAGAIVDADRLEARGGNRQREGSGCTGVGIGVDAVGIGAGGVEDADGREVLLSRGLVCPDAIVEFAARDLFVCTGIGLLTGETGLGVDRAEVCAVRGSQDVEGGGDAGDADGPLELRVGGDPLCGEGFVADGEGRDG